MNNRKDNGKVCIIGDVVKVKVEKGYCKVNNIRQGWQDCVNELVKIYDDADVAIISKEDGKVRCWTSVSKRYSPLIGLDKFYSKYVKIIPGGRFRVSTEACEYRKELPYEGDKFVVDVYGIKKDKKSDDAYGNEAEGDMER